MLAADNITVELGGNRVLESVAATVNPGEVVAILGPNGAGKSTLLAVLSGAHRNFVGSVSLNDRPLREWSLTSLARQRAVMSQQTELGFPFRVLEVVMLGRSPHRGLSTQKQDLRCCHAALEQTSTTHLANRFYTSLSGGERQRVQLARVMAQLDFIHDSPPTNRRYLLLDEPTSALDLTHQHAVLAMAKQLSQRGFGIVTVLHDPNLAARYADRILLLQRGQIHSEGTPDQVMTESTIGEVYELPVSVSQDPIHRFPRVTAH